jgi:hypothetical protein
MAYRIIVNVKGVKDPITHSVPTKEEAEQELNEIREVRGAHRTKLAWLAVAGQDVLSAHLEEIVMPRLA